MLGIISLLHEHYAKLNEVEPSKCNQPYFRIYNIDGGEGFVSTRQEKLNLNKALQIAVCQAEQPTAVMDNNTWSASLKTVVQQLKVVL